MARRTCTECGSGLIQWMTAVDLLLTTPDLGERKRLAELVNLVGGDSDAWRCGHCGNWGVFGPSEIAV
jgi:hypothetical protein